MKWNVFYDSESKWLKGGYDLKQKKYMDFFYPELGTDARTASLIAIGSKKVPQEHWQSLLRILESRYEITYLGPGWRRGGLFLQYLTSLLIDERGTLMDQSAANATYAQLIHAKRKHFDAWGWSASSSPSGGYLGMNQLQDDVVSPHASILGLSHYPESVIRNLKVLEQFGARPEHLIGGEYKKYGFRDSIGLEKQQVSKGYLMLDQCMIMLAIAHYLKPDFIYQYMKNHPWIINIERSCNEFHNRNKNIKSFAQILSTRDQNSKIETIVNLELGVKNPLIKPYVDVQMIKTNIHYTDPLKVDGDLSDWKNAELMSFELNQSLESGIVTDKTDLDVKSWMLWNERYLYFAIEVYDQDIMNRQSGRDIYKDDCIELFIDPKKDKFIWSHPKDFQIGFSPISKNNKSQVWSWFQKISPSSSDIRYKVKRFKNKYIVESAISWKFLGMKPKNGLSFGLSPAVHDKDQDQYPNTKLNWCYFSEDAYLGDGTLRKEN